MQPQHLDTTAHHPSRGGLTADSDADAGGDVFNTAVRAIIDAYGASVESEGGEIACARGESPRSVAEDMINRFEADLDSAQRQAFQTTIASALMRYVGATGAHKLEIRAHIGVQKPDGLDGDGGSMYWVRAFDGDYSYGDDLPQIHRHLTPEGEKMALENNSELNALYGDHNYLFLAIGAPQVSDSETSAHDMAQEDLSEQATDTDIKACLNALAEIDPAQAQALRDSYEAGELSAEELAAAQAIVQLHDMQELAALAPDAEGAPEIIQAVRQQVQEASMAVADTRIHTMLEQLAAKTPAQPQAQPAQSVQPGQAPAQPSRQTIKTAPKRDATQSSNASRPQQERWKQTAKTEKQAGNPAQKTEKTQPQQSAQHLQQSAPQNSRPETATQQSHGSVEATAIDAAPAVANDVMLHAQAYAPQVNTAELVTQTPLTGEMVAEQGKPQISEVSEINRPMTDSPDTMTQATSVCADIEQPTETAPDLSGQPFVDTGHLYDGVKTDMPSVSPDKAEAGNVSARTSSASVPGTAGYETNAINNNAVTATGTARAPNQSTPAESREPEKIRVPEPDSDSATEQVRVWVHNPPKDSSLTAEGGQKRVTSSFNGCAGCSCSCAGCPKAMGVTNRQPQAAPA